MQLHRWALAAGVLAIVAVGCGTPYLAPPGVAPIRFRDAVFANVTKTADVVYGSAVNQQGQTETLILDMYRPTGDTHTSRPAIVWIHGGSFSGGDKTSPELIDETNIFAQKGYVNVSINYRLTPGGCSAGGPTPACLTEIVDARHDAQAAVRFLRKNAATYGIDPNRIAVAGTSAGAITAMEVAYGSDDVGVSGNPGFPSTVRAAVSLSGASLLTAPDPGEPPTLDFHGTADPLVPYAWATATLNAAKAVGDTAYLTTWPGAGHVPYGQHHAEIIDQTTNFLWWEMDLARAAG